MGTVRMAAGHSTLPEYPEAIDEQYHLIALIDRYAAFARNVRDAIEADLFTEISRAADKHLWFLEAHLQSAPEA